MKEVPEPPRIAALDKDKRGYPIPWNVLRGVDGSPVFTANESTKHMQALEGQLCPICGVKLGSIRWFVGGPLSAFHPDGGYMDLPGHRDCVEYALQVCPYLAAANYLAKEKDLSKVPDDVTLIDHTMLPGRPPLFVMVACRRFTVVPKQGSLPTLRPEKPYLDTRYWKKGFQLTASEGMRQARESLLQFGK
jgi:hypothetical protein